MPQKRFAVVIGVGGDLSVTVDDANAVAAFLKDKLSFQLGPFNDTPLIESDATRRNFLNGLDWLSSVAGPDDTAIVYFSGHGAESADFFFITHDADPSDLHASALSGTDFALALKKIKSKRVLVLLDCCHAGSVEFKSAAKSPLPKKALDTIGYGRGKFILASSRKEELSWTSYPYSQFTKAILEGLAGKAAQECKVWITHLVNYVQRVVPARTGNKQHPVLHTANFEDYVLIEYPETPNLKSLLNWVPEEQGDRGPQYQERCRADGMRRADTTSDELKRKLKVIQDRIEAYALPTDVPLQLSLEERRLIERLELLEKQGGTE